MSKTVSWRAIWMVALIPLLFTALPGFAQQNECLRFNYNNLTVVEDMGSYGVADNDSWVVNIGGSRPAARVALHVMQHYRMDEVCYVGSGRSPMTYFLTNRDAPMGKLAGDDCTHFRNYRMGVTERNSGWALTVDSKPLLLLGPDRASAEQALTTIRDYNFNNICFIDRQNPAMIYFLR